MAFDWLSKLRGLLPVKAPTGVDSAEATGPYPKDFKAPLKETKPETATPTDQIVRLLRLGTPVSMFAVGALISACTQLIGIWAILGYLLVVAAPIVYWLQRIEQRLVELNKVRGSYRGF